MNTNPNVTLFVAIGAMRDQHHLVVNDDWPALDLPVHPTGWPYDGSLFVIVWSELDYAIISVPLIGDGPCPLCLGTGELTAYFDENGMNDSDDTGTLPCPRDRVVDYRRAWLARQQRYYDSAQWERP